MPARIGFVAGRRDADGLHAILNCVISNVRGKVEFPVRFPEAHVRLVLRNGLQPFFPAHFGEVGKVADLLRRGIEGVNLRADVDVLRRKHVVNLPIAGGTDAVVTVVRKVEARVVDAGRRRPLPAGFAGGSCGADCWLSTSARHAECKSQEGNDNPIRARKHCRNIPTSCPHYLLLLGWFWEFRPCGVSILAMTSHGQDARATNFPHFEARDSFPSARIVTKKPAFSAKYACFCIKCRSVV